MTTRSSLVSGHQLRAARVLARLTQSQLSNETGFGPVCVLIKVKNPKSPTMLRAEEGSW